MPAPKDPQKYEEWKRKLSEASKRLWEDPEYKNHMSEVHRGKKLSKEHREKISKKNARFVIERLNEIRRI